MTDHPDTCTAEAQLPTFTSGTWPPPQPEALVRA